MGKYDKERQENFFRNLKYKAKEHVLERGEEYSDYDEEISEHLLEDKYEDEFNANKNPKFSKDVIERVLKRKIKEGKEEQKEFYESQKRQEKEVAKFFLNRKPIVFDSDSDSDEEIPKTIKIKNSKANEIRWKNIKY